MDEERPAPTGAAQDPTTPGAQPAEAGGTSTEGVPPTEAGGTSAEGVPPAEAGETSAEGVPPTEAGDTALESVQQPRVEDAAGPSAPPAEVAAAPAMVLGAPALPEALRRVLPAEVLAAALDEDDIDAFPLPAAARRQEMAVVDAAAGYVPKPPVPPAPLAPETSEAIRRFHQELGLVPADPAPLPAVAAPTELVTLEDTPGGGGGGDGGDGGGDGGGNGGGGGRRKRGSWFEVVDRPMTIFEHLDELRKRLMWAVAAFIIGTAASAPFVDKIIEYTAHAVGRYGLTVNFIAGGPTTAMYAFFNLAIVGGCLVGGPVILYQVVAYVMPALTRKERGLVLAYLPAASLLFLAGLAFGYFVFEPVALRVFATIIPQALPTYTLDKWVGFMVGYALPFALIAELPVITAILVKLGLLTPATLARGRKVAFFASVVVAMAVAPPVDVFVTPSFIVIPTYGLFEISIIVAKIAYRQRQRDEALRDAQD